MAETTWFERKGGALQLRCANLGVFVVYALSDSELDPQADLLMIPILAFSGNPAETSLINISALLRR